MFLYSQTIARCINKPRAVITSSVAPRIQIHFASFFVSQIKVKNKIAYFNRLQSLGERSAAVEFAKYKWESVTKRDYYTMNEDDGIPILAPAMKRSRNNQPDVHYYTDAEAKRRKGQNGSRILLDDESNGLG